ncbi:MAG TPA: metallophosphoesterase [Acidimicrobiales bacterium]|nr:metallophosphoesterase [Acidimicrobiales bacterium]
MSTAPPMRAAAVRVAAAGDISCKPGLAVTASQCEMEATARLVEQFDPAFVLPLGDLQYEYGELANFQTSYDKTWGRFRDRTKPVVGNHEYAGGRARGYFAYWGDQVAPPNGWYAFDVAEVGWRVIVLNSVCSVVGCDDDSEQASWLRGQLSASTARCTLAAFHHPRRTSGLHGEYEPMDPLWRQLVDAGADLALSGHDHHYERFAPEGTLRQFVAGTGGRNLYPVVARSRGSEFVDTRNFGILELDLREGAYGWRFRTISGAVLDEGQADCR